MSEVQTELLRQSVPIKHQKAFLALYEQTNSSSYIGRQGLESYNNFLGKQRIKLEEYNIYSYMCINYVFVVIHLYTIIIYIICKYNIDIITQFEGLL